MVSLMDQAIWPSMLLEMYTLLITVIIKFKSSVLRVSICRSGGLMGVAMGSFLVHSVLYLMPLGMHML